MFSWSLSQQRGLDYNLMARNRDPSSHSHGHHGWREHMLQYNGWVPFALVLAMRMSFSSLRPYVGRHKRGPLITTWWLGPFSFVFPMQGCLFSPRVPMLDATEEVHGTQLDGQRPFAFVLVIWEVFFLLTSLCWLLPERSTDRSLMTSGPLPSCLWHWDVFLLLMPLCWPLSEKSSDCILMAAGAFVFMLPMQGYLQGALPPILVRF